MMLALNGILPLIDTVEIWGSSLHEPTISLGSLRSGMAFLYMLQSEATPYIRRSTLRSQEDISLQISVV